MLTGRRSLTKIFPDSVSKYERDAERKGGERAMPLNSSTDVLTERKVGPSWRFLGGKKPKSFAYRSSVHFKVPRRGSLFTL